MGDNQKHSRRITALKDVLCVSIIFLLTCLLFKPALTDNKIFIPSDLVFSMAPWAMHSKEFGVPTGTPKEILGPDTKAPDGIMIKFHNMEPTDVIHHQYPYRLFYQRNILKGKVPLWNPHQFCGAPFNGNDQSSIFYPFQFLFYRFLDAPSAYTWLAFMQFFLGGLFMYLLMRFEGAGHSGGLLSAIIFMFNGCAIVWMPNTTFQSPGIWLPLILLLAGISYRRKKILAALLCSVVIGTLLTAGLLQYASYALFALLMYTGWHMLLKRKDFAHAKFIFISSAIMVALGVAISTAHVWPVKTLSSLIYRVPRPPVGLHFNGLPAKYLKTIIFPDLYGSPIDMTYNNPVPYMSTNFFIPAAALALCVFAFIMVFFKRIPARKRTAALFYFILMIFALAAMFGNPVYAFYYYLVPGAKTLKVSRIGYLFTFGASASAGFGLFAIKTFVQSIVARACANSIVCADSSIHSDDPEATDDENLNNLEVSDELNDSNLEITAPHAASSFTDYLRKPYLAAPTLVSIILILVVSYCLIPWAIKYSTFSERKYLYPEVDSIKFLKEIKDGDKWRVFSPDRPATIYPNVSMALGLDDIRGYDSLNLSNYGALFDAILSKGKSKVPRLAVTIAELPGLISSQQLNWLNVRYIITTARVDPKRVPWYDVMSFNNGISILRNKRAYGRAFFPDEYAVIANDEEVIDRISENGYKPDKIIYLSKSLDFMKLSKLPTGNLIKPDMYLFKFNAWEPGYIEMEASIPTQKAMFFSETFYPGWKASIDDVPVEIVRANAVFRAVPVPAGKHVLKMWFAPRDMIWGFYISLIFLSFTAIAIIVISIMNILRRPQD